MLLVSLVHQFIWLTFNLVFTRNGIFKYSQKPWMRLKLTMTSIFIMSDRAAFRGTFRIEANQTSKVELYTCKIASWTVEGFKLWNIFAQSSIFDAWLPDCVPTWGKTTQIRVSVTYLWKVTIGNSTCTLDRTYKIGMLKLPGAKQKVEEIKLKRLNQVESTHSQV